MNMRIQSASLGAVCLLGTVMLLMPGLSSGQSFPGTQPGPAVGEPVPVPPPGTQPAANGAAGWMYRGPLGWTVYGSSMSADDPRAPILQTLGELKGRLRDAADEEKEAITAEIETSLGEYFDRDMEHRRSELDRLTQRADDAEALNDERQAAREELIDLQYQAFIQDAAGLEVLATTQSSLYGEPIFPSPQPMALSSRVHVYVQDGASGEVRDYDYAVDDQGREIVVAGPGGSPATVVASPADERQAALNRITQARQALETVGDEAAGIAAQDELKAALGEYFDRDMEFRASELEGIRTSLAAMETKIAERADARADIIDLQFQIIVNEAAGLGFFSGGTYDSQGPVFTPTVPR